MAGSDLLNSQRPKDGGGGFSLGRFDDVYKHFGKYR
jgi:hypothetical protein